MDYEICFYYVDGNQCMKFYQLEEAKAYAKELAKELKYYPSIKFVGLITEE